MGQRTLGKKTMYGGALTDDRVGKQKWVSGGRMEGDESSILVWKCSSLKGT